MKNQFEGGGSELSDQLLDPDVPTLASQDKLKVSPKGLPFVTIPKQVVFVRPLSGRLLNTQTIARQWPTWPIPGTFPSCHPLMKKNKHEEPGVPY